MIGSLANIFFSPKVEVNLKVCDDDDDENKSLNNLKQQRTL